MNVLVHLLKGEVLPSRDGFNLKWDSPVIDAGVDLPLVPIWYPVWGRCLMTPGASSVGMGRPAVGTELLWASG